MADEYVTGIYSEREALVSRGGWVVEGGASAAPAGLLTTFSVPQWKTEGPSGHLSVSGAF